MPGFEQLARLVEDGTLVMPEGRGFEDGHDHPGIFLSLPDL